VLLLPIRLALYALALILALRQFRQGDPRRLPVLIGLAAAVAAIEIGLSSAPLLPARGAIDSPAFLVYLAASLLLLGAAWFLPAVIWQSRHGEALPNGNGEPPLLGVGYSRVRDPLAAFLAGQLAGGLIAYFGLAPGAALRAEVYPLVYLSNRGIFLPEIMLTARFNEWAAFVGLGLLAAGAIWAYYGRVMETTGRAVPRLRYAALRRAGLRGPGLAAGGDGAWPETITVERMARRW
jgi:hypothetical protein